ncbi:MAG TPA: S8 family peptidase [Sphingomonas sp.]|nr:S8 family peptidase [Sphingomonas sp.]
MLAGVAMLAACGGAGGVESTPTPPAATAPSPAPTPAPTTAPTPAPTSTPTPTPSTSAANDTAEYRATVGAVSMNALAAYNAGASGSGIGLAIIDSGIDLQSAEFGNRIASASRDVVGNASIDDEDGHGTAVAFTAAGRRNGAGSHGVAPEATLIVLRADRPGTCAAEAKTDGDSTCTFPTNAIAQGVDVARNAGARVINMSLGGAAMTQDLIAALDRATAAGIVIVIAAGNDGTDNPDEFAAVAENTAVARGQVIVAGAVDSGDAQSSFSDKAGSGAAHYLAAVGERVRAPDEDGEVFLWSGTSFAAPQISGAVALLAQAFPNLTGAQIVDLLLRTARDGGAVGTDAIYGRGVMDLTRAFQPVGTSTLAGATTALVTSGSGAELSAPMGDANVGTLGAVILDGYGRAFATDLARGIGRAARMPTLASALRPNSRAVAMDVGSASVSLTLAARSPGGETWLEPMRLTSQQAGAARAIAGSVTQRIGGGTSFGLAFSQSGGDLAARLAGIAQPAFLVADGNGAGFDMRSGSAGAVRQEVGAFGVTTAIEHGDVLSRRDRGAGGRGYYDRSGYARTGVTIDRRFGALSTSVGAARLNEQATMLGARFAPALGAARASTWFVDAQARVDAGAGWSIGGSMRRGWTRARLSGIDGDGALLTSAFAADIGKQGVFGRDSFGVRIAQPLRVERGGIDLSLPTDWNYATLRVGTYTPQRLNLTPQGREIDAEARYSRKLGAGDVQTNLFWRRDPGNVAGFRDDYGLALRYNLGF